jgi:hypothetical protein
MASHETAFNPKRPMEEKTTQQKKKSAISSSGRKKIISLWLDDYDNIFSDFDPRPYSTRTLSDDFIDETKKVTYEAKPGLFDVTFLIPQNKRNRNMEKVINRRLHAHFNKHHQMLEKEFRNLRRKGFLVCLLATFLMFTATSMVYLEDQHPVFSYILVLLEPSAWFAWWFGLDHIFYISKANRHELEFNRKMSRAEIRFDAY